MPYFKPATVFLLLFLGISESVLPARDVELLQGSREIIPCTTKLPPGVTILVTQWYRTDENQTIILPPVAPPVTNDTGGFLLSDDDTSLVIENVTEGNHSGRFACVVTAEDSSPDPLQWNFDFKIIPNRVNSDVHLLSGATERVPLLYSWRRNYLPIHWCKLKNGDGVPGGRLDHFGCDDPTKAEGNFEIVEKRYLQATNVTSKHAGSYKFVIKRNDSDQQTQLIFRFEVDANRVNSDVHLLSGAIERVPLLHRWRPNYLPVQWCKLTNGDRVLGERLDHFGCDDPTETKGNFEIVDKLYLQVTNATLKQTGSYKFVIRRNDSDQQTEFVFRFVVDTNRVYSDVHLLSEATERVELLYRWRPNYLPVQWCKLTNGDGVLDGRLDHYGCDNPTETKGNFEMVEKRCLQVTDVTPDQAGWYKFVIRRNDSDQQTYLVIRFEVDSNSASLNVYLLTGAKELITCDSPMENGHLQVTWYRIGNNCTRKIKSEAQRCNETCHPFDYGLDIVKGKLVVNNVTTTHEGSYQCVIERRHLPQQTELKFKFIVEVNNVGSNVHLLSGTAHVVPCINVSNVQLDVLSVKWYRLGTYGTSGKRRVAYWDPGQSIVFERELETVNSSSLMIKNVNPKHRGTYECILKRGNSAQQTEVTFNFIVQKEGAGVRDLRIVATSLCVVILITPFLCRLLRP